MEIEELLSSLDKIEDVTLRNGIRNNGGGFYNHNVMRFAQMANRVFGCPMNFENPEDTAKKGIIAFRKFLASIGMPVNFEQLGAKEEDIPVLVKTLGIGDGVRGGFMKLDKEAVTKIYEIAAHTVAV